MKAITVEPHKTGTARLEEVREPDLDNGSVLVEAITVGVCGTDAEIVEGKYGWAPPGKTRLVLGHESLGRVLDPGSRHSVFGGPMNGRTIAWKLFVSELIGTALLVLGGLSLVILMFGTGTSTARSISSEGLRSLITGFLFWTTGASIALSPVGKMSGAHINPAVTLAFALKTLNYITSIVTMTAWFAERRINDDGP